MPDQVSFADQIVDPDLTDTGAYGRGVFRKVAPAIDLDQTYWTVPVRGDETPNGVSFPQWIFVGVGRRPEPRRDMLRRQPARQKWQVLATEWLE